jgi:release factor glutamine methyltransferase
MNTITELLRNSAIDAVDGRALLRATLGVDDAFLVAHAGDEVAPRQAEHFRALAARRTAGEPVAYITGEREFYGRVFAVSPAVLIPRPETELLVELALERVPRNEPCRVLDLGTGSGCIAISIALERPAARVTATDCSAAALQVARRNAQHLGAGNVDFKAGNWLAAVGGEKFSVIVSNPPYVADGDVHLAQGDLRFEPRSALVADADGLACIRTIVAAAPDHLLPGGWLLLEHGYNQASSCRALLAAAGFAGVQSWRDLAGIERVSGGQLQSVYGKPFTARAAAVDALSA